MIRRPHNDVVTPIHKFGVYNSYDLFSCMHATAILSYIRYVHTILCGLFHEATFVFVVFSNALHLPFKPKSYQDIDIVHPLFALTRALLRLERTMNLLCH